MNTYKRLKTFAIDQKLIDLVQKSETFGSAELKYAPRTFISLSDFIFFDSLISFTLAAAHWLQQHTIADAYLFLFSVHV
jgi:hypothetical protein